MRPRPTLRLAGEIRHRGVRLLDDVSATRAAAGAEFRPRPWLPLRGGLTLLLDGHQWSGGVGEEAGALNLQLSAGRRSGGVGGGVGMVVLSFGGR